MKANWAFLNQPSTIEPIVIRHAEALGIAPVASQQFGTIDAIPMRPATEPNSEALAMLLLALEAGLDPTTGETIGGVEKAYYIRTAQGEFFGLHLLSWTRFAPRPRS